MLRQAVDIGPGFGLLRRLHWPLEQSGPLCWAEGQVSREGPANGQSLNDQWTRYSRVRMSEPRRHHFVPRAYLMRFAGGDQVLVRQRDSRMFLANPTKVAVECGFYNVTDATGKKSSQVEGVLAEVDGNATTSMQWIDRVGRPPEEGTNERHALAVFLALQNTRTPEHRERVLFSGRVMDYADGREVTRELVAEFLERVHLGFAASDNEVRSAFDFVSVALREPRTETPEFAIHLMLQSVGYSAPLLASMNWTLEVDRKEQLITSDLPIVIWRTPSPRDKYEGVGLATADEVRFPLDPGKQLVLSKRARTPTARITPQRARACNWDAANGCHRFLVGRPNQRSLLLAPPLAARGPRLRFHTGPMYVQQPDGTTKRQGELLHIWTPRR